MKDQQPNHVFISYVRENQEQVYRLCQDLERHGVNVWLDRNNIKPGARWKDAIREAINKGAFFMACFSEEYRSKSETYMNEELTLAIERLRKIHTDREWFIPVLLSECDVPARSIGGGATLLDINWEPLYKDWDAGIQRIISTIKPKAPISTEIIRFSIEIPVMSGENKRLTFESVIRSYNDHFGGKILNIEQIKPKDIKFNIEGNVEEFLILKCLLEKIEIPSDIRTAKSLPERSEFGTIQDLIKWLRDGGIDSRCMAAKTLGQLGPKAKIAIPDLIDLLDDRETIVRKNAAEALWKIDSEAVFGFEYLEIKIVKTNEAVLALVEALKVKDREINYLAVRALGNIGREAVPYLIKLLHNKNSSVRQLAAEALAEMGPDAKVAIQSLIKALNDNCSDVRAKVVEALGEIGPDAKDAISILEDALNDKVKRVRIRAVKALKKIDPDKKDFVKELIKVINDPVSMSIFNSLSMDLDVLATLEGLDVIETSDDVGVMEVGESGSVSIMINSRIENLKDKDSDVRWQAAMCLGKIDPGAVALPALIKSLKDEDSAVRWWVAEALGRLRSVAGPAIPTLIECLKDEDRDVRWWAAKALGEIGTESVSALSEALKDRNKDVRRRAVWALGEIGSEAYPAVPALIEALKNEDEYMRHVAAEALKKINTPEARKALEKY